ncbi:MAG TPA: ATP-binding protein, partial [Burkholderiaceae bacterium]|nr:ATP-binding protein [Burkholderiaceae bacterium]
LNGGAGWREFLARSRSAGRHDGVVDLPKGARCTACALSIDGVAIVMLGGVPADAELETLQRSLPMLASLLQAEQAAALAAADAAAARDAAGRAHALAAALDAARSETAKLNAELRDEHRRKDEFLAMLAHELRNPLAPLVTSVELLRRPHLDAALRERQLDVMARQIARLARLVDDLLDVSRVSSGRIELRRQRVALRDVLRDALDATRPLLDARRHRVEGHWIDADLTIDGDPVRLTQVFANLLHNAAKYTDPQGTIRLTVQRSGDAAVVELRDNGVGISAEMLPRIFDLFAQAPVALDRSQGGLGIGLTLVRALVRLHGGQVDADSAGPGCGSTFTVALPLAAQPQSPGAPAGADAGAATGDAPTSPLCVLVVDDNRDAADSLAQMLHAIGHRAITAYEADPALELATAHRPDLVLLDIGLPGVDGYQLAGRLRRQLSPPLYLVALTGYGGSEHRRRALEAGFDEHAVKPVTADALQALLARASAATRPASPAPAGTGLCTPVR